MSMVEDEGFNDARIRPVAVEMRVAANVVGLGNERSDDVRQSDILKASWFVASAM
jgi:hypothetical protein